MDSGIDTTRAMNTGLMGSSTSQGAGSLPEDKHDYKITALGEDNYVTWKWQMNLILTAKGLDKCVIKGSGTEVNQAKITQATILLASSLSQLNMQRVINCKTALQIWETLESTFENKSATEKAALLEQFMSFKIQSTRDVSKGIGEIQSLAAKLTALGTTIASDLIVSVILKALPESLSNWASTWKMVNAEKLELNKLITGVMAEVNTKAGQENAALVAKTSQPMKGSGRDYSKRRNKFAKGKKPRTGKRKPSEADECFNCGKTGHWAKDCKALKREDAAKPVSSEATNQMRSSMAAMALMAKVEPFEQSTWIADSGCSFHMTPNRHWLSDFEAYVSGPRICLGDGHVIEATGKGYINTSFGMMVEVHHVPDIRSNLFSIAAAARQGARAIYDDEGIKLVKQTRVIVRGYLTDGLYTLNFGVDPATSCALVARRTLGEWHRRLGHISPATIREMARTRAVSGLVIKGDDREINCTDCALSRCTNAAHRSRESGKATEPGACLHMDTVGPIKPESLGGSRFFLICKDEASSYKIVKAVASKAEIPNLVKQVISQAEVETNNSVRKLATDNGSEFINNSLKEFLANKGIMHATSVPYVPQQNGLVEREIRTIVESARSMLSEAALPKALWAEAIYAAVYVLNRTINRKDAQRTPFEHWFKRQPDVSNLHRFGQRACVLDTAQTTSKFDSKAEMVRFIGYTDVYNTFRFYHEKDEVVVISCNVRFLDEEAQGHSQTVVMDDTEAAEEVMLHVESEPSDEQQATNETSDTETRDQTFTREVDEEDSVSPDHDDDQMVTMRSFHRNPVKFTGAQGGSDGQKLSVVPRNDPATVRYDDESDFFKLLDFELPLESTRHVSRPTRDSAIPMPRLSSQSARPEGINRDQRVSSMMGSGRETRRVQINVEPITEPTAGPSGEVESAGAKTVKKYSRKEHIRDITDKLKPSDIHPKHIVEARLRKKAKEPNYMPTYHANLALVEYDHDDEPKSYAEAMLRPDKDKWIEAMNEEIMSLVKNDVFELVERPNCNIVTNKWVLKIKRKTNGEIDRYKARLVARGFSQIYGMDYHETYAPVVNTVCIRMLFAMAAARKLHMSQFDVKTAFLNGTLDETVYMEQPEGFAENNSKVCRLKRSLYGLKQSPRQWNKRFTEFLTEQRLAVSQYDNCVFYKRGPLLILAIYVDDGIIFAEEQRDIEHLLRQLKKNFEIHQLELSSFLGFQIHRGVEGEIYLHQFNYIKKLLKTFRMTDCAPIDTPASVSPAQSDELVNSGTPYREAVGSLLYAAIMTRVDIAQAVAKVARRVENPTVSDWKAVKRIFRYLKGKENYAIAYMPNCRNEMTVYCDADFAGDQDSSRSTSGMVFMIGDGPINWKSTRQNLISLSSTEAEFVSLCQAVKDTVWLKRFGEEISIFDRKPVQIYSDNQSAIRIASNEKCMHRTRHMSVQASYPREQMELGIIKVDHIPGDRQLADVLTKPLAHRAFMNNISKLMRVVVGIIMCLAVSCRGEYIFDRVNPQIWIPTRHWVETNSTVYELTLTHESPCKIIKEQVIQPLYIEKFTNALGLPGARQPVNQMYEWCMETYEKQFVKKLNTFIETPAVHVEKELTNNRRRRFVPFIMLVVAIPLAVSAITNILSGGLSEVLPWGDGYRIRDLKQANQLDKERINMLYNRYNQSEMVLKGIQDRVEEVSQIVLENRENIHKLEETLPQIAWTVAYVQSMLTSAADHLNDMIMAKKNGQLHTYYVSEIWNFTQLSNVKNENTMILEAYRVTNHTIIIKIAVRAKSRDAHIYETFNFDHIDHLHNGTVVMKYDGPKYLIYNTTSKCVKSIEQPKYEDVSEDCQQHEFRDPQLGRWRQVLYSRHDKIKPVVKRILTHNYIYCYGYNITFEQQTHECPIYPFKFPLEVSFTTGDVHHYGSNVKLNVTGPRWRPIDSGLPSAFMPTSGSRAKSLHEALMGDANDFGNKELSYAEIALIVIVALTLGAVLALMLQVYRGRYEERIDDLIRPIATPRRPKRKDLIPLPMEDLRAKTVSEMDIINPPPSIETSSEIIPVSINKLEEILNSFATKKSLQRAGSRSAHSSD